MNLDVIRLPSKATHRAVTRVWAHPDGRRLVALTGTDLSVATLTWWDVDAGRRLTAARLPPQNWDVTLSPDHRWYVAGREVRSPDAAVRTELSRGCRALAFSLDGSTLFGVAHRDRATRGPWPVDRWAMTADGPTALPPLPLDSGSDAPDGPDELAVSPDGRGLFVLTEDRYLARYALPDGGRPNRWAHARHYAATGLALSPDGATVALVVPAGLFLVDADTLEPPRALFGGGRGPFAFTPDSRRVVTAGMDGTAAVWDAADGRVVARYDWHPAAGMLFSVAVAPDGLTAYAGGTDGRIVRWDLPD